MVATALHLPDDGSLDLSQFEPVISDERVERIAERLRSRFGHRVLEGIVFVSFIQPAKEVRVKDGDFDILVPRKIPDQAVFGAIARDPRPWRKPTDFLMGAATVELADFRAVEKEHSHFVSGGADAAWAPFLGATSQLLGNLESARQQITGVPYRN